VIEAVGDDVNSDFAGKSVTALTRFGGQSDLIAVKATQVFDKPAGLTFEQSAAIPVNYLTAYALLVVMGSLHDGAGFSFDNERPRHRAFVEAFELASRPVTNGEYAEFVASGGYDEPAHWLSDGYAAVRARGWRAPLYWEPGERGRAVQTLAGLRELDPDEPVCHVSWYEADAYARSVGARRPTETEWEIAAAAVPVQGNFVESGYLHPVPARKQEEGPDLLQAFGDVWEWTRSPYGPYPGFRPPAGALGEYNGKFMSNQLVLRGGSCATPASHVRASYRNFFYPHARWQFSGIRLARDR
jgi:ergothioneine biosynthesis protein EgtB